LEARDLLRGRNRGNGRAGLQSFGGKSKVAGRG